MRVYDFFSGIAFVRGRFDRKLFLATVPLVLLLIAAIIVITKQAAGTMDVAPYLLAAVFSVLGIAACACVLFLFRRLTAPLKVAKTALDDYLGNQKLPDLPVQYEDEAGRLLAVIQATVSKLDRLIVEKSDMVDLLSHDVRSPVGRILSLSSLVKVDEAEKDLYADYITNECTGLLSMLENILLILKEDSHVFRLEFVNLSQIVQETLSFFSFAAAEKNLNIEVSIDDRIYIPIQEQLFKQAIRNILGNAIKFSPDGKTISITGIQDNDSISLCIKDEGLGFKSTDMEKIFQRFTTAGKKGTHGEASTGLGLYLSKKIVEKHGGKLVAQSGGENKGASFTIVLYRLIIKKPQEKTMKQRSRKTVVAFHQR